LQIGCDIPSSSNVKLSNYVFVFIETV